jgi:hypothetical protein
MSGIDVNFGVSDLYRHTLNASTLRALSLNLCMLPAALQALSRAMSGNYVNFGVFDLYGDAALKDALSVALRMALSIPLADIMSYK